MGSLKKVPSEGGSGGKRGHSAMEHWAYTQEIKAAARHTRRVQDRQEALQGLIELENDGPGVNDLS
jgi:hypothetical protein